MIRRLNNTPLNTYLKIFCFITITLVVVLSLVINLTMSSIPPYETNLGPQNGRLDISKDAVADTDLFCLQGEWSYYKNVYFTPETFDDSLLVGDATANLPYSTITQAKGTATYKLDLKFENKDDLLLYIPYLRGGLDVFLNGKPLVPIRTLNPIIGIGSALFEVSHYDEKLEYQQLVISTNKNPEATAFYKRDILLASAEGINTFIFSTSINQFMFFAMLLVITFNGFVFMFLYPSHKIMTSITIFDALLMVFITTTLPVVFEFFANLNPHFEVYDSTRVTIKMLLLLTSGVLGIYLSKELFDPDFKVNKRIWHDGCMLIFVALAILFLCDMSIYDKYGTELILLGLLVSSIGVLKRFKAYYDQYGMTGYFVFQSIKTTYLCLLIFLDIMMSNLIIYNSLSIYNFFLIFIALHLVIRVYDNYINYKEVAKLNTDFEDIVAERTQSLSEANAALQKSNDTLNEISIKDALTKINNRLYFERKVEELLGKFNPKKDRFYLCIFDLDFFKIVNDTYGHESGDRALIGVATIGTEILPKNSIFSRIGGEEFAVIFMDMDDASVLAVTEKLRARLEVEKNKVIYATTGSFGLSKLVEGMDAKNWFVSADKALYRAKNGGRNKIMSDFSAD